MKVVLLEKVQGLGEAGAMANVSPGYFRNYLAPKGLAIEAKADAMREYERRAKTRLAAREKALDEARALAARLGEPTLHFTRKVSEGESLYGSVTAADVLEALEKKGLRLDKKLLAMKPIKTLGSFGIPVHVHPDVEATLKIQIDQEG